MKSKKTIPYYEPSKNMREQINKSSSRRKMKKHIFLLKKIRNILLENLAYNCPVNSWRVQLHKWRGVHIGKNVFIGLRCTLDHAYPEYIYLEDNVGLAGDDYILTHSNPQKHFENIFDSYVSPVVIKKGTWIAINATILPGVTIGEKSVIGAGIVINKDVPPKSIVSFKKNRTVHYV